MRKCAKIICLIFIGVISLFSTACKRPNYGYQHPTYNSAYTSERHVKNIKKIIDKGLLEFIANNQITNVNVEILHSFYDYDPEFFLVEVDGKTMGPNPDWKEGDDEWDSWILKDFHGYIIGFINNDKYYEVGYYIGESPYRKLGYENNKKYFGYFSLGVEENGVIYKIADFSFNKETITEKKVVTKEEEKKYMEMGGFLTQFSKPNDLHNFSENMNKTALPLPENEYNN